jgi:hypothetical protein
MDVGDRVLLSADLPTGRQAENFHADYGQKTIGTLLR